MLEQRAIWAISNRMLEEKLIVEIVQGVTTPEKTIFPLATYGWDGGSAINSQHLNLT